MSPFFTRLLLPSNNSFLHRYCPGVLKGGNRVLNGEVYKCTASIHIQSSPDSFSPPTHGPLCIRKGEPFPALSHAGDNERGVRMSALQREV